MKKQLSTLRMMGLCLGEFARAVLGGLIVTYTLKFFNVTPSSGLPLLLPALIPVPPERPLQSEGQSSHR